MKKLLAVAFMSTLTVQCLAVDSVSISINNDSDKSVNISDQDGNQTSIGAHKANRMLVKLRKQRNTFPIPNDLLPHIATITADDGTGTTSTGIDEHTTTVTINADLTLTQK